MCCLYSIVCWENICYVLLTNLSAVQNLSQVVKCWVAGCMAFLNVQWFLILCYYLKIQQKHRVFLNSYINSKTSQVLSTACCWLDNNRLEQVYDDKLQQLCLFQQTFCNYCAIFWLCTKINNWNSVFPSLCISILSR